MTDFFSNIVLPSTLQTMVESSRTPSSSLLITNRKELRKNDDHYHHPVNKKNHISLIKPKVTTAKDKGLKKPPVKRRKKDTTSKQWKWHDLSGEEVLETSPNSHQQPSSPSPSQQVTTVVSSKIHKTVIDGFVQPALRKIAETSSPLDIIPVGINNKQHHQVSFSTSTIITGSSPSPPPSSLKMKESEFFTTFDVILDNTTTIALQQHFACCSYNPCTTYN